MKTKISKPKIAICVGASITIIVLTTILVKMFTLPTDIILVKTIKTPDLSEISEIKTGNFRQKAISLDGRIVQGTNKDPQPTASTAKMILGLAIMKEKPFEKGSSGEVITITPEFYNKYLWYITHNGSTTRVSLGEKISQYDALASVFLASSNNLADSLAIWAFGSLENYQGYATKMLQEMDLKNTTVGIDASGYDESTTSTAEDLAKIATEVLKNPVLREIVSLKSYTVPVAGEIKNTNKILGDALNNSLVVSGVKTGYIGDASGYNLISSYEMDGHFITMALLGASTREASFEESKDELMRLSAKIIPTTVISANETVGYFETWWNGRHEVKASSEIKVVGIKGEELEINLQKTGAGVNTSAEIDITAEAKVTLNGEEYTAKTYHEDFSTAPTFWERFLHVFGWTHE